MCLVFEGCSLQRQCLFLWPRLLHLFGSHVSKFRSFYFKTYTTIALQISPTSSPPLNGTQTLTLTITGGPFVEESEKRDAPPGYALEIDSNLYLSVTRNSESSLSAEMTGLEPGDYNISLLLDGKRYSDDFVTFTFYGITFFLEFLKLP